MVVVVVVGRGWVKMSAAMAGRRWKFEKKKHWLKRLNAVHQKTKFGPKYKWFKISYLKSFFWKYFFGHTTFLYSSTRFSGHLQSFIYSEIVKTSKNYRKRSLILQYSFAQKTSLILRTSTHIENNMVLQYSQNLSTWWEVSWGRLNNFIKAAGFLDLVKCVTIFHFNWNFCDFNYFSAFWYFHL